MLKKLSLANCISRIMLRFVSGSHNGDVNKTLSDLKLLRDYQTRSDYIVIDLVRDLLYLQSGRANSILQELFIKKEKYLTSDFLRDINKDIDILSNRNFNLNLNLEWTVSVLVNQYGYAAVRDCLKNFKVSVSQAQPGK